MAYYVIDNNGAFCCGVPLRKSIVLWGAKGSCHTLDNWNIEEIATKIFWHSLGKPILRKNFRSFAYCLRNTPRLPNMLGHLNKMCQTKSEEGPFLAPRHFFHFSITKIMISPLLEMSYHSNMLQTIWSLLGENQALKFYTLLWLWLTLSNALTTSKYMTSHALLSSNIFGHWVIQPRRLVSNDLPFTNPCWEGGIILLISKCFTMYALRILLKARRKTKVMSTGL